MKTKTKKIPYFTVKVVYRVRTRKQATELLDALNITFANKRDEWCKKPKLPKNWGKVSNIGI